ncbi:MAG TPA: hypothetical protein DCS05_03125 [Nitrospiraceae bacterium]|nr:hypothetical protein [Nitrospiraceae bacterium]
MYTSLLKGICWTQWSIAALCLLAGVLMVVPAAFSAEKRTAISPAPRGEAFLPGEALTYNISWSKAVKAGTAVMEVRGEELPDGREVLRFIVTSRTEGIMGRVYPLGDTVQSVFDLKLMQSLSYTLEARHGKRTRRREMVFDHANRKVVSRVNDDPPTTLDIPAKAQDTLSAFYYLRTRNDFAVDRPMIIEVFDGRTSRSIEVLTMGREKVKTPAGEFNTIKIKASGGIFLGEGEVLVWLTDDSRKVPVRIKSSVAIGSIVFTLKDLRSGQVITRPRAE